MRPAHTIRKLADTELDQEERHTEDADRLAEEHAEVGSERDRVGQERAHVDPHQPHLRVHEGEDRQDHEVHRRVDQALQAHERRGHAVHHALHLGGGMGKVVLAQDMAALVKALLELGQALAEPLGEVAELDAAGSGHGKGEDHAGERGMHTRLEHAEPEQESQEHIGRQAVVMRFVERHERGRHECNRGEPERIGALAVKDGDGRDGDEVVGDGERGEEHAHARWHAVAQKRENAERERDVGGHGDRPSLDSAAAVEECVDAGRDHHAADRREHGQERAARVLELAHAHLVFELDAHEQEEDRHKEVVHERLDRDRRGERAGAHAERRLENVMDYLVDVGVRADHGRYGREHHHRGRDGSVLGDALPDIVALKALALPCVE